METSYRQPYSIISDSSRWMERNYDKIADKRINELFLLGSHDSGSYRISRECRMLGEEFCPGLGWKVLRCRHLPFGDLLRYQVSKWSRTQACSILSQLIYGVRYFDFRLCFVEGKWMIHHGPVITVALERVLGQIFQYLTIHLGEIVLLSFSEFLIPPNNEAQAYQALRDIVDWCIPCRFPASRRLPTVREMISQSKRILIFSEINLSCESFWPSSFLSQGWVNVPKDRSRLAERLYSYYKTHGNDDDSAILLQFIFTPTQRDIVSSSLLCCTGSLRERERPISEEWIREVVEKWNEKESIRPIVFMCDFVSPDALHHLGIVEMNRSFRAPLLFTVE